MRDCLVVWSRNSPTTGLAPMEAKCIRRRRYSLWFQARSFFLLALLIRLSGKLNHLNYNNCPLERFPTRLFFVLNLAHMPEHPFFPELLAEIGHQGRTAGNCTLWGSNMGPIVLGRHRSAEHQQRRRWPQRRWPCMNTLAAGSDISSGKGTHGAIQRHVVR